MSFSISGNAGVANALVHYGGNDEFVTADGSGNYTISGLSAGTYRITPALTTYAFSPAMSSETIVASDITGVNFTASNPIVVLTLTPQATDNFTPDANPLNPTNWQQSTDMEGEFEPLQALSGTCVATSDDQIDFGELWIGSVSPNDQYVSIQLNQIVNDGASGFAGFLRSSPDMANQYEISIFSVDATHLRVLMSVFVDGAEYDFASLESFTYANDDVFTFVAVGSNFYVLQNGTIILHGSDTTFSSGLLGLNIDPFTTPNVDAVILSSFVMGSVSSGGSTGWSPVDCRDFATFPNSAVLQNSGAEFYTGQTSSNSTVPGTDSRAAGAPVDSRAAGAPVNSRVNPADL
jgi:hypothetical protein